MEDAHPWGCHRPRIKDRIIFDKLVQVLVLGASYAKISDSTCSPTTLRTRRDEWIAAGIFEQLEQICLEFYDRIVGLDLENLSVDGCIVKALCGGEVAGRSPVDRGKQGTKRSLMVDGHGICVAALFCLLLEHGNPAISFQGPGQKSAVSQAAHPILNSNKSVSLRSASASRQPILVGQ